jgi:hypothetical protein
MKTTWKKLCVAGTVMGVLAVTQAFGQATQVGQQQKSLIERAAGTQKVCLATKALGMTVKDKANQNVGQVRDLVIDESGQVQYLAIASQEREATIQRNPAEPKTDREPGQALREIAANTKLTLVPYEAAQFHEEAIPTQSYVSLNLDKDRLMQAPSFTRQQLTAQAQQAQWMSQVDKFFNREAGGAARPNLNRDQAPPKVPQEK